MWYKIERTSKQFVISNIGDKEIYISLYVSPTCDRGEDYEIIIPEVCILAKEGYPFYLPSTEGLYKLFITDKENRTEEVFIPQYEVLLNSLIEDIDNIVCGCECSDCDDCNDNEKDSLTVMLKLLAYNTLNRDKYSRNLAATSKCIECDIFDISRCNLLQENVIGNIENTVLLKKLVSYYYLVFYYTDLYLTKDEEMVKKLYKFSKIFPCVKKYIKDIKCIALNSVSVSNINNSENNVGEETLQGLEFMIKALQSKLDLLEINFTNLQNLSNNYQSKLIGTIEIQHIINDDSGLPSGSVVNWDDIAFWKGFLYTYVQRGASFGEWEKLNHNLRGDIIYNGQPREDYVYSINGERYLYNGNLRKLIQISECCGDSEIGINITPNWVDTGVKGWSTSNSVYLADITGAYGFKEQKDMNVNSSTYNQTRWIATGERQDNGVSSSIVFYGDIGTSPENFQNMSIEAIFDTTKNSRKILTVIGTSNNNFVIEQKEHIHYLLIPRDKTELVKAEFGSALITTLWDNATKTGAYKTSNLGGVWQGLYYNVYFFYAPGGIDLNDIRLTLKNK